jgi:hypothetical protein
MLAGTDVQDDWQPWMRGFLFSPALTVGGGTSEALRNIIPERLLGIPNDPRGYRGTPDVSYNANPGTGFAVYDSVALSSASGCFCVGGTSAGSPQWAALLAISNSMRVANRKAPPRISI